MPKRIILDTETTGLNDGLKLDVPISIAVLDYDTGEVLMNTLVNSGVPIDAEASAVHGITAADLDGAPPLEVVLLRLSRFLGEVDQVEAYNAGFDLRIIGNALWREAFTLNWLHAEKWRDAMTTYSILWNQPNKYHDGQRNVKLTAALEMQGLPLRTAHGALNDAIMCADLIRHMEHGKVRLFRENEPYTLSLASLTRRSSPKAGIYASFSSAGGQMVNVFEKQFSFLFVNGYRIREWLSELEDGETFTPARPIVAQVTFKDGWCNLYDVLSKHEESMP